MKLLLDTHALIWWLKEDSRMTRKATHAIATADDIYFSPLSFWEVCIKATRPNADIGIPLRDLPRLASEFVDSGFQEIQVAPRHCLAVPQLPTHHGDPFDRLLIATAQVENLTLVSKDRHFPQYDVKLLW